MTLILYVGENLHTSDVELLRRPQVKPSGCYRAGWWSCCLTATMEPDLNTHPAGWSASFRSVGLKCNPCQTSLALFSTVRSCESFSSQCCITTCWSPAKLPTVKLMMYQKHRGSCRLDVLPQPVHRLSFLSPPIWFSMFNAKYKVLS